MTSPGSPYRDDLDVLRERAAALESELSALRARASELAALRSKEDELVRTLTELKERIAVGTAPKRGLPLLDALRVASPCTASWDDMVGDAKVRFCLSCDKSVYNVSAMTADEAESLLQGRAGAETCVRFYRRHDGTVLTADCPVGVRKKRRKLAVLSAFGAGALVAAAAAHRGTTAMGVPPPVAGGMMMPGDDSNARPRVHVMGEAAEDAPVPAHPRPRPEMGGPVAPPVVGRMPAKR